jgi:hypothetical protein
MNTLKQELTRKLKYCEIKENDEFEDCIDIYDIASDEPFCSIYTNRQDNPFGLGMSGNYYDVCKVDSCFEYGNTIRDDKYIAKSCTIGAVVALVTGLHITVTPAKRAAYKHIKDSTYGKADTIFDTEAS